MSVVKLLLGKAPHEMDDDELANHIRNIRKLRGEAFTTGRQTKKAKSMASGGKGAKELSELAGQLGVGSEDLVSLLLEVFDE